MCQLILPKGPAGIGGPEFGIPRMELSRREGGLDGAGAKKDAVSQPAKNRGQTAHFAQEGLAEMKGLHGEMGVSPLVSVPS
jgi:hypothetical protein